MEILQTPKAYCNVLLTAEHFSTKKGKVGENHWPQNIIRCRVGRPEKEILLSKKEAHLVSLKITR